MTDDESRKAFPVVSDRRVALLHIEPVLGCLDENRSVIESGTRQAAELGADWVISGELVESGYGFMSEIGSEWIDEQPDGWLRHYAAIAGELQIAAVVSHPEREGDRIFNTMYAIDRSGSIVGKHRKVCVTPISEDWSTAGDEMVPVILDDVPVGLLVCADAYPPGIAEAARVKGAVLLLSSAAWHPGQWGPNGAWEDRSHETGLPIIVCNRTGVEGDVSYLEAESALIVGGARVETFTCDSSMLFLVDMVVDESGTTMNVVGRYGIRARS